MTDNAKIIASGAKALGINEGDTVLMHSSLKSLGRGFTPSDVIEGLLAALGEEGTLVLPALSYLNCNASNPVFDYYGTKSNVGAIPEYFRTSVPGVIRSVNPTHSCCALGKNAEYLTSGHILDETPCGLNSPFRRLMLIGGKILFLGCGTEPNTSMHAVEELAVPDYLFGDVVEYKAILADGSEKKIYCRAHWFKNVVQRYDRLEKLLPNGSIRAGYIANADCRLISTPEMWETALAKYRENPHYFVDIY